MLSTSSWQALAAQQLGPTVVVVAALQSFTSGLAVEAADVAAAGGQQTLFAAAPADGSVAVSFPLAALPGHTAPVFFQF